MNKLNVKKVKALAGIKYAEKNGRDPSYMAPEMLEELIPSTQVKAAIEAIVESINKANNITKFQLDGMCINRTCLDYSPSSNQLCKLCKKEKAQHED